MQISLSSQKIRCLGVCYTRALQNTLFVLDCLVLASSSDKGRLYIVHHSHSSNTNDRGGNIWPVSWKNLVSMMRGLNPLKYVPLVKGDIERSDKFDPWLRSWWVETLNEM